MKTNYWDGKGEPEVGQLARVLIQNGRTATQSLELFVGLDVEIIGKFQHEGDLILVIYNSDCGHKSLSCWRHYLAPIKSEREIAIEEMAEVIRLESFSPEKRADVLYDLGFRNIEVK